MAREFIPEIVSPDIGNARRAVKLSCLYFDKTALQHRVLYVRPRVGAQVLADGQVIRYRHYHTEEDVDAFLVSLQPLCDAGVLLGTPDPPDKVVEKRFAPYAEAAARVRDNVLERARGNGLKDVEHNMRFAEAELVCTGGFLDISVGCPSSPERDVLAWFCHGYRKHIQARWEGMPKEDKARARRDALATSAIQQRLPNVADLHVEDILRLRERQRDNLLRFRAEMGTLVETLEPDMTPQEFDAFVKRTIEEKIGKAVAELQAQLNDLRRTSWVKARERASAAGLALMGLSAFSGAAPPVLAGVGVLGAVAGALHTYSEHRAARASKLEHPFALFIQA